ncbi:PREDICTED: heavy metal-associated isoprenylated plant protein 26-like [Camelina sativa]|uniref:Heavy metal-associated isoprenylated plant protein 26-like n=1 Tax=Camelina sativa TaxID=90675 RepID=A0ABM0WNG0_CAMSA|nr:PREDICTED: heavy metal-associated isoprenylated plant protein 26-like [Camelina sativa]
MKKMVVTICVYDEGSREKVMRTVASCSGITAITIDPMEGKLTVIGKLDEMQILKKLKRRWHSAKMVSFGPFDAKKEAEAAAAAEKKKKEESERERERMEALYRPICPIHHHHSTIVYDHDHHGCIIS